ncbi:MAG: DUF2459 domain-containing protein [Natronospirillum sp.]|uniref:DUF2459 domain-containing protein n=1 Tax=Natronospirillum sp. TaxID=2812955 RepID=UPI0025D6AFC5|nr:DUF2459 domain-containing protein [Natronospirillum sp.]MCH8552236.1 DUF2459 domain-containing protein [Natronospirillum sp.]
MYQRKRQYRSGGFRRLALLSALCLLSLPLLATEVHITRYSWHTGVVIAAEDLHDALAFVPDYLGEAPYYEFGWGDAEYYQRGEDSPWLMAPAALWPTDSVMHVVALPDHPDDYFPASEVMSLSVDEAGMIAMTEAIAASFELDEEGAVQPGGAGLYARSLFFTGEGRFHLRRTCNTWTLEMLQAAGLPVEPSGVIRASGVMEQLESLSQ